MPLILRLCLALVLIHRGAEAQGESSAAAARLSDVLLLTSAPWNDFESIMHMASQAPARSASPVSRCPAVEPEPNGDAGTEPSSIYKLQMQLRHIKFLENCPLARQVDAVFLGDSMMAGINKEPWSEMCSFSGGCANFGIDGLLPDEALSAVEHYAVSCLGPKVFVVVLGTDAILQGLAPNDIAEQTARLVMRLRERFCESQVLLAGLLPILERAEYDAYMYKEVDPGAEPKQHFAKVTSVNKALASFADELAGVTFAGCHDLFLDRADENNIDRLLLRDGIHFTQPGERLFFQCLRDDLTRAEQRPKVLYIQAADVQRIQAKQAEASLRLMVKAAGVDYRWSYSRWGPCSGCSEGSTRTRTKACVQQDTLVEVDSASCRHLQPQPLSQPCRAPCPSFRWVAGEWGRCSRSCGGGKQSRQVVCMASNGTVVEGGACGPLARQGWDNFRTVQRCGTHECRFPRLCSSDDVCPPNSECRLLKCTTNACKRHEAWLPDGAGESALARLKEVQAYEEQPLPADPPPSAPWGVERFFSADLRVNNDPGDACQGDAGCVAAPLDLLPWYIRHKSYSGVKERDLQTCYSYCATRGDCLATSARGGSCVSRGCDQEHACSSPSTDFAAPGVTECLHTGGCRIEGCRCLPGFTGPTCAAAWALRCPPGQLPAKGGCCAGAVSRDGNCCESGTLDSDGACCVSGMLDACGTCDGRAAVVDVLGECCRGSLDAAGLCCEEGLIDDCGVCGGDGLSCAFRFSGRIAMEGATLSGVTAQLRAAVRAVADKSRGNSGGETLGEIAVEDISIELDSEGKMELALAEFVIYLDAVADRRPKQLLPAARRVEGQSDNIVTRIVKELQDNHGIGEFIGPRRSGVCGNGICEVGESTFAGALEPNLCREDCPFDDSPHRCELCQYGTCTRATGACDCFHGYTGTRCDECDKGYFRVEGACAFAASGVEAEADESSSAPPPEREVGNLWMLETLGGGERFPGSVANTPLQDPILISFAVVTCLLLVAFLALVIYHVLWKRRAAQELAADSHGNLPPRRVTHDNPLDGDEDLPEPVKGTRSISEGLRMSQDSQALQEAARQAAGGDKEKLFRS